MAASKRNTVGLILVLALVGGVCAAGQGDAQKPPAPFSNTRSASCLVNITVDPEIVRLDFRTAENLVLSSAVAAKAAREVLAMSEEALTKLPDYVKIEFLSESVRPVGHQLGYGAVGSPMPGVEPKAGTRAMDDGGKPRSSVGQDLNRTMQQSATLKLAVVLPAEAKPAAEEFLKATIENLRRSLVRAHAEHLEQLREMVMDIERQRRDAQQELDQAMGVKADSGTHARVSLETDADSQSLRTLRRGLENEVQDREMNLAVAETRRSAIEEQIDLLRDQAAKKLADDTVAHELQGLVKANEARLQDLEKLVADKTASNADLAQARESLARTRIDLAKRQEELARISSGGQLDAYAGQISGMAVQTAEERTRLQLLRQRLQGVEKQLASAHDHSSLVPRVRMMQEMVNALDLQIGELKMQQTITQPPTVTVIGAN